MDDKQPIAHEDESRAHPVREDMRFQYASWIVERVAWVLLALVPLVALTGVFAHGILSETTAGAPGSPLTMQYERFQRETALSRFTAHIPRAESGEVRLRLSPSFQQAFEIESMQPQPARSSAGTAGLELFFNAPASGELIAVIWTRPRQFGLVQVAGETDGGGAVKFAVFVYP
jgi:hypothetical protein